MKPLYSIGAIVLALSVFGGAWLLSLGKGPNGTASATEGIPYVEIVNPSGFVNSDGVTIGELVGKKVVLVEFLTYSCINCQRTFPYVVSWYSKYRDEGLEIIGIHTPEFAFEKNIENVRKAMHEFGIEYPIVLDNEYATWNAYGNKYWPRKYLIDIHGNIVYDHIGEGAYEETEEKIRELLTERARVLGVAPGVDTLGPTGSTVLATPIQTRSPETYFGSLRNENFGNGTQHLSGVQTLTFPQSFAANTLYLDGVWDVQGEYAETQGASRVAFMYDAAKVHIVASAPTPTTVTIVIDGIQTGTITIDDERLYTLVDDLLPGSHLLELRLPTSGLRLYAFTFG